MRKQMAGYFRGLPGAGQMRGALMICDSAMGIRDLFSGYLALHPEVSALDGDGWIERYLPLDRDWIRPVTVAA
jgi:hypothetical protein